MTSASNPISVSLLSLNGHGNIEELSIYWVGIGRRDAEKQNAWKRELRGGTTDFLRGC